MGIDSKSIRDNFSCLQNKIGKDLPIYFDSACVTLKPNSVIEKVNEYYLNHPSCHNRAIHKFAEQTSTEIDHVRSTIKNFIDADKVEEIIFTKNTTEGLNLLSRSINFTKGDIVLTSDFEHNSNLLPWQFLSQRSGIDHHTFTVDLHTGLPNLDEYEEILKTGKVKVVSTFHTSHVMGITLPIKKMCELAHKYGALFILDAAQALGHHKISVNDLDVDFLAFSFHKIFGPSGIGCLYGKKELLLKLEPFLVGGETVTDADYGTCTLADIPERFEAGLQNYAGIMGAGAAVSYLEKLNMSEVQKHELEINSYLSQELGKLDAIKILGPDDPSKRGSIFNVRVDNFDAGELSILLDKTKNIMVRSGVHCCHAYFHKHNLKPTIRFSISIYNTLEEAKEIVKVMSNIIRFC